MSMRAILLFYDRVYTDFVAIDVAVDELTFVTESAEFFVGRLEELLIRLFGLHRISSYGTVRLVARDHTLIGNKACFEESFSRVCFCKIVVSNSTGFSINSTVI